MVKGTRVSLGIFVILVASRCGAFVHRPISPTSISALPVAPAVRAQATSQAPEHAGPVPEGVSASQAADRQNAIAPVFPEEDPAVQEAREEWLAGVAQAAARFGCDPELIQQLPSESVAEAVKYFSLTARKGSCLVLTPVSTQTGTPRYTFASGGKVDGVEILYLSDVPRVRIWNGVEVAAK